MSSQREAPRFAQPQRSTSSRQGREVTVNVYDLLPAGRLSTCLWAIGIPLIHSGVVINDREYAYGGHDRRGITGVYWTKPKTTPPGGRLRCELLQGFTLASESEMASILQCASDEFKGISYNLLTKNCNHFTTYLCEKLTGKPCPGWLNRAAGIGVALPCVVPRNWMELPDVDNVDGELLDEESSDEQSRMLPGHSSGQHLVGDDRIHDGWEAETERQRGSGGQGKGKTPSSQHR